MMELYGSLAFDTLRLAKLWKLAPHKSPASHIQHSKCFSINHQLSEINSLLRFFTQKPKGIKEKKSRKTESIFMNEISVDGPQRLGLECLENCSSIREHFLLLEILCNKRNQIRCKRMRTIRRNQFHNKKKS